MESKVVLTHPDGNRYQMCRKHVECRFETCKGTVDDAEWILKVVHYRSGDDDMQVPGRTTASRTAFKQDMLRHVMQETMDAASTRGCNTVRVDSIGVVLGDMNLKSVEVETVMHSISQPQLEVAIVGSDTQGCLVAPLSIPWSPAGARRLLVVSL